MRKHGSRRTAALILAAMLFVGQALHANPVDDLADELRVLFDQLGMNMVPHLQTVAVTNHELGMAELGDFPSRYFSFSLGASVAGDFLGFIDRPGTFNLLDPNNLLDEAGVSDNEYYDRIKDTFPYPMLRAVYGMGLTGGYELSFHVGVVPRMVTDLALGLADQREVSGSLTNLGGRVRKVLIPRGHGLPAISAGVGYTYSAVRLGYELNEFEVDFGDDPILLNGEAKFNTTTHSFGVDVRASGKIMAIYPFVGATVYHQRTRYEAGIEGFEGVITINGDTQTVTATAVQPYAERSFSDVNVLLNTGLDRKMGAMKFFSQVYFGVCSRASGGILGFRIQL